jgi:hypothetical protein
VEIEIDRQIDRREMYGLAVQSTGGDNVILVPRGSVTSLQVRNVEQQERNKNKTVRPSLFTPSLVHFHSPPPLPTQFSQLLKLFSSSVRLRDYDSVIKVGCIFHSSARHISNA